MSIVNSNNFTKREEYISFITRRVIKCPVEKIETLWGVETRKITKQCRTCKKEFPVNNFYCKSVHKMHNNEPLTREDFESECIPDWDKRSKSNRKYKRNKPSLISFMV